MPKNVNCPVRWHSHLLPIETDPERPNMVIARCGDRIVYRASGHDHLAQEAGLLDSMTVPQLKGLPEWEDVPSPKPQVKDEIIDAILQVRRTAKPFKYQVPSYKE